MLRNVSAWTVNNRSVQTKSSEASKIPHLKEFQNLDISYKKKKKKKELVMMTTISLTGERSQKEMKVRWAPQMLYPGATQNLFLFLWEKLCHNSERSSTYLETVGY